jgi:hypothetical protein
LVMDYPRIDISGEEERPHMNLRIAAAVMGLLIALTGCTTGSSNNKAGGGNGNGHHAKKNKPSSKPTPHYTPSQTQAIGAAKNYLSFKGFSKKGLVQQLSSQAGDGYKLADAVFAVNHIKVDWNAEAVKSAKNYLSFTHFSCSGLIQQLDSAAGDQFTPAQAQYAGKKVGLC